MIKKVFTVLFLCNIGIVLAISLDEVSPKLKFDQLVVYTVQPRDNLSDLTQRYLMSKDSTALIQNINKISNANLLPVGKKLFFPRSMMRSTPSQAQVFEVRCATEVARIENGEGLSVGMLLTEGQVVAVPVGCSVDIKLDDGSNIRLPSNSSVKLTRLRRNELEKSPEVLIELIKGHVTLDVQKPRSSGTPFEVRTPVALMGVRGTEFSVSIGEQNATRLVVTDGKVQSLGASDKKAQIVESGQGIFIDSLGISRSPENLPGRPQIKTTNFISAGGVGQIELDSNPISEHWLLRQSGVANQVDQAKVSTVTGVIELDHLGPMAEFLSVAGATSTGLVGPDMRFAVCAPPSTAAGCQILFDVNDATATGMVFSLSSGKNERMKRLIINKPLGARDGRFMIKGLLPGDYAWTLQYTLGTGNKHTEPIQKFGDFQMLHLTRPQSISGRE